MTLPVLSKTWQFPPAGANIIVPGQIDALSTKHRVLRAIKDALKSFVSSPWTVRGSSNAVAAGLDSVDRWTTDADVVSTSSGGVAHSWVVLRQTGIATNFELLIDCYDGNGTGYVSIYVSAAAGFTGGSITARPTATDEVLAGNHIPVVPAFGTGPRVIVHAWQSTDGACTRLDVWQGGVQTAFWLFEKPKNPTVGWTNPSVSFISNGAATFSEIFYNSTPTRTRGRFGSTWADMSFTAEYSYSIAPGSYHVASADEIGAQPNDFDGSWPFLPIGIVSKTVGSRGRHGQLHDIWWKPKAVGRGDTFPNDSAARQFVALGEIILPWTGNATVPLTA